MTDVPIEKPTEDVAEDVLPPAEPDPEEYEAGEREQVSDATGTAYAPTGEPESTPHDEEPVEDDDA
ncbi:hypothetical protein [Nocardioides dongkuii]|uniref:hypothetical protein n=1 Tax=Nocardioides dongkuii TaxID=2760089 RepID=UPI0015FDEA7D|nr:hypothetical protein [Nocardioides dongkuii]